VHTLEVRNRTDRNGLSSGNIVRFKQLQTNRDYRLHTWQYSYDGLARVIAADQHRHDDLASVPETAYSYAFDLAGNRTREAVAIDGGTPSVINTSYNAANQISSAGYTYDPNGNMTSDGTNAYVWDRANRLTSVGTHSFAYDGMGNRRMKTVSGIVTRYLLDVQPGLAQVIAATTGTDTTRTIHGPRGIHAQETPAGAWQYPLTDGLGSVRTIASGAAAALETTGYDPFGVPESPLTLTDFAFTGEQRDGTGLQYHRARYVNPALGVFASLDPFEGTMARAMSLNGYGWVEGNSVNWLDPSGAFSQSQSDRGYIEGMSAALTIYPFQGVIPEIAAGTALAQGEEIVYNFATFERLKYNYTIYAVDSSNIFAVGGGPYVGVVSGFRSSPLNAPPYDTFNSQYSGPSFFATASFAPSQISIFGVSASLAANALFFVSSSDFSVRGITAGFSGSLSFSNSNNRSNNAIGVAHYTIDPRFSKSYISNCQVDKYGLAADILTGDAST